MSGLLLILMLVVSPTERSRSNLTVDDGRFNILVVQGFIVPCV